ncbi:MAG TPA: TolC family protein [Mucilaginibacter sp.]
MKKSFYLLMFSLTLILPDVLFAQSANDTVLTLKTCIDYALRNQPAVRQASIDQEINEKNIRIGLADWLPQVSTSDFYQHYFNGGPIAPIPASGQGMRRSEFSSLSLQASQVVYNNNVLQAAKAAKYSRLYYQENTLSSQINVVSDVSKAFFDVLLSEKQLEILNEDIIRLQRSLKDAYNRYLAGIVDKTDYKQATISLNNSLATRKQTAEAINSKLAYLKQIMDLSKNHNIVLSYDSTHYEQEAYIDTLQKLDVNNRIEYRLLQTQKNLDNINVSYYKWGFLPSVSLQGNYSSFYSAGRFSNLYDNPILNSYAGITLNMPIFQGTKRLQNLSKARLQVNRADLDIENSANTINTEYAQALAGYKSNYTNWKLIGQNVDLAKDVYKVVSLQYREGIKTYLDVIIALSDLRTAELNYYNALFQLLSSKIDLEKAMGVLNVQ